PRRAARSFHWQAGPPKLGRHLLSNLTTTTMEDQNTTKNTGMNLDVRFRTFQEGHQNDEVINKFHKT
ncbi:hypothetical protein, partial [Pseudovibrio sp. SPO723]|uniref:hypothetical protein n=1 Tax=Nesiotobacter zosterae TaxID=392721 RepID=UPI0029C227AF